MSSVPATHSRQFAYEWDRDRQPIVFSGSNSTFHSMGCSKLDKGGHFAAWE